MFKWFVCIHVNATLCVCVCCVHRGWKRVRDPRELEFHSGELPCGCWSWTPSPLKEQPVLSTAEPSLQPLEFMEPNHSQVSVCGLRLYPSLTSRVEWRQRPRDPWSHSISSWRPLQKMPKLFTRSSPSPGRLCGIKIHRVISRYPTCLFKISLAIDIQLVLLSAEISDVIPVGTHTRSRNDLDLCLWHAGTRGSKSVGQALFSDSSLVNYESEINFMKKMCFKVLNNFYLWLYSF